MNLLLAGLLLLQDQKAEDLLTKLIEPIEKAKTLKAKFSWKTGIPDESDFHEGSESLLLKDGTKVYQEIQTTFRHQTTRVTVISDGVRFWDSDTREVKGSDRLPTGFQKAIALLGFSQAAMIQGRFSGAKDPKDRYPDLGKLLEVVRVTSGTDETGTATLSYQIDLKSPDDTFTYLDVYKVTLWYEPKSLRLLKRRLTCETNSAANIEIYDEYTLNAEIPNEQFSVDHWMESAIETAKADLRRLRNSLATYQVDNGTYPTREQGLEALLKEPQGSKNWNGPYLEAKELPKDPWGLAYEYHPREIKGHIVYYLFSSGPDRKPGTGDDIVGHLSEEGR